MLLAERTIVHQVHFHELPSILIPKQWICHVLVDEEVRRTFAFYAVLLVMRRSKPFAHVFCFANVDWPESLGL